MGRVSHSSRVHGPTVTFVARPARLSRVHGPNAKLVARPPRLSRVHGPNVTVVARPARLSRVHGPNVTSGPSWSGPCPNMFSPRESLCVTQWRVPRSFYTAAGRQATLSRPRDARIQAAGHLHTGRGTTHLGPRDAYAYVGSLAGRSGVQRRLTPISQGFHRGARGKAARPP